MKINFKKKGSRRLVEWLKVDKYDARIEHLFPKEVYEQIKKLIIEGDIEGITKLFNKHKVSQEDIIKSIVKECTGPFQFGDPKQNAKIMGLNVKEIEQYFNNSVDYDSMTYQDLAKQYGKGFLGESKQQIIKELKAKK